MTLKVGPIGTVTFAGFVDEDHILTTGVKGKLTLWDIANQRAVYTIATPNATTPVFSANRKYLIVATQLGISVIEPLTGKTLGSLPGAGKQIPKLALHPNGTLVAGVFPQRVVLWDLATQELAKEIFLHKGMSASSAAWVDDQ